MGLTGNEACIQAHIIVSVRQKSHCLLSCSSNQSFTWKVLKDNCIISSMRVITEHTETVQRERRELLCSSFYRLDILEILIIHTHQNEVRLIRRQHENGDVVVGQWRDDWLSDFGDSDGRWVGGVATARHHVKGQPCGIGDADVLWLGQLWEWTESRVRKRSRTLNVWCLKTHRWW